MTACPGENETVSNRKSPKDVPMEKRILPTEINAFLAARVLGQQELLRRISVSLYKHIHGLPAPNVLLIGNSGTGKTTLMQAVAAFYDAHPELDRFRLMLIINANTLSPEVEGEDRTTRLFKKLEARAKVAFGGERLNRPEGNRTTDEAKGDGHSGAGCGEKHERASLQRDVGCGFRVPGRTAERQSCAIKLAPTN